MRSAQRILDAAVELIERDGFDAVNMASVAKQARVSRQTVYANFGTREDLVSRAMSQVVVGLMQDIRSRLPADLTGAEYLVELFVATRAVVRAHPALDRLRTPAPGNPVFDADVMERARPILVGVLLETRDRLDGLDVEDAAEPITRTALSVLLFDSPATRGDDELRHFLGRWVMPVIFPPT